MKKLMTFTAVIALAMAAHSAQYIWGLGSGDFQDHEGNILESGTAFLYLGTVTADQSSFDTGSATLITSGGFDSENYVFGSPLTDNLQSSDSIASVAAGQAYSIVLLEDSGVASLDGYEGYYTIITGESIRGELPGTTVTYYADFSDFVSSAYTTSLMQADTPPEPPTPGVPEPTSGLLLVMGLAGLALKRKRA